MYHSTQFLYLLFLIYVGFHHSSAITCHNFNDTCGPESISSCTRTEECGMKDHCYILWQNTTIANSTERSVHVKLKGCIHFGAENESSSNPSKCVASIQTKNDTFFCSCVGDLCNNEHIWAQVPIKQRIPSINADSEGKGSDLTSLTVASVVLLTFVFCCFMMKRRFGKNEKRFKLLPSQDLQQLTKYIPFIPAKKRRPIELEEEIAQRRYGSVHKATDLETMQKIAVKIMAKPEEKSWLMEQEVYQLPLMDGHECILKFVAAEKYTDKDDVTKFFLMTVFEELGSLQDYLKTHTVTWRQLFKIALSFARGVAHLHEEINTSTECKPSVAHRDLKSSNVLLKSDFTACIADFGLALIFKPCTSCGDTHGQVGTRRYMAPEVLEGAINFSKDAFLRIDMYAFGLVLWELMSRCCSLCGPDSKYMLPFEAEVGAQPTLEVMQEVVVHQKRRPIIKDSWRDTPAGQILCDTIEECWDHDAEARLSASCAVERIMKAQPIWAADEN